MARALVIALLALGAGCTTPPRPDAVAAAVLTRPMALECPQPELRKPPAELLTPPVLETPTILDAGQGDYGVTRDGLEKLVTALQVAGQRIARWKAWATGQ